LYKTWLNPPLEIFLNFNLLNLKNPLDFQFGAKPVFEEIGPFVYREYITKEQVMDNQNFSISYKERRRYEFRPDLSVHGDDFNVTTLNLGPIVVLQLIKYLNPLAHNALNIAFGLTNETLVITKSAREIIFGYKDNLLRVLKPLMDKIVPGLIQTDEIGFFIGV
jgi:hypothetical protein